MRRHFNYIIPIFNKEDLLTETLSGVDRCASPEATIVIVIDGCTDGSESIVDTFIARSSREVIKLHMPNVHMLRSVNAGLARVPEGFTVVMQDDIILQDVNMEHKIWELYLRMGERLGVISMRLGANIGAAPLRERLAMGVVLPMIRELDFIKGADDPQLFASGAYESFYPRVGAINGPNIIPWSIRHAVGLLDEALAPYGYDDPEYGLRAMKCGFINGVFPLKYRSDKEWGGSRRNKNFAAQARLIHRRNRRYIWIKHGHYIRWLWRTGRIIRSNMPVLSLGDVPDCRASVRQ